MSYENNASQNPAEDPIESASAGTACQTTTSKFAYILTAAVLGGVMILGGALSTLVFGALRGYVAAGNYEIHRYDDFDDDDLYHDDYDYDDYRDLTPEQERELDELLDRLFDEDDPLS
ncbi:MAG: hypothetical protein E7001_08560 [Coriobacteriaceae bacterium]|nr:hypothetical protein [Coriobacteriaceae bacterium]